MHTLSNLAWHSITFDLSAARQLQIFYGCVVGVSVFLNVDATIVLGLGCHVCLKIIYAINMQHKVFIALFVPFSFTVCGCPECALLSFYFLRACVCAWAPTCTQTPVSSQPHTEGGPLSWPQLLCVSLLTHYVWQATLLLLSCCSRALPPTSSSFLVQTHMHKAYGGQCPLMQGFTIPSQFVGLPFACCTYYAVAFFSQCFVQNRFFFVPAHTIH